VIRKEERLWAIAAPSSQHSMGHFSVVFEKTKYFMGLLIFVWGIYTELQNCISNGPWPLPFPITGG
jgi:hypothetical protein